MALLTGKTGLIVGIANDRSYAWHIAKSFLEHSTAGQLATSRARRTNAARARRSRALGITDPWLVPLDAGSDADLDAAFAKYTKSFDQMHFLVHSIAFAEREWLAVGKFTKTPPRRRTCRRSTSPRTRCWGWRTRPATSWPGPAAARSCR